MEDNMAVCDLSRRRPIIGFIKIASRTCINQVSVALVTTRGNWLVVVNGQFTTGIDFGNSTVTAAELISRPNVVELWMRQNLVPDAKRLLFFLAEGRFQASYLLLQTAPAALEAVPLDLESLH